MRTADRLRTTRFARNTGSFFFSIAALAFVHALPAEATPFATVFTSGSTATDPAGQTHTSGSDEEVVKADPVNMSAYGDEAAATSSVMGRDGSLSLSAHACTGPPLGGPGGGANAGSQATYNDDFIIESDTLPIGTPVTINVRVAAARSFRSSVQQPFDIRLGGASTGGQALVRFTTSTDVVFRGSFSSSQIEFQPIDKDMTGIFVTSIGPPESAGDRAADTFTAILGGRVGDPLYVYLTAALGSSSSSLNPVVADADSQMSLNWGAEVEGGLAVIRRPADGQLAPPSSNVTDEGVLEHLPLPPITPEPSTAVLLLIGAGPLMFRRSRK